MPTKHILVIGGAGYIGSHMVLMLQDQGYTPIVLDNISTGHRDAVSGVSLFVGDMSDKNLLRQIFSSYTIHAVMHFASYIDVAESVSQPAKYYQNNIVNLLPLLDIMAEFGIKHFIYSSSAAVYGEPQQAVINESHSLLPISPYGRTKRIAEEIIADYAAVTGMRYAILRYFNAAGADPKGRAGERHIHESHLIPRILVSAQHAQAVTVFGNDYATVDGTCVRDYVHINDLCVAHLLALMALSEGKDRLVYNVGNGKGFSVLQVIEAASKVTAKNVGVAFAPRRAGDPAILVADASLIKQELSWRPQFNSLESILTHAWQFMLLPVQAEACYV